MKNLFHKGLCLVMALCCIAFKGYAGGGTLPDAQGHDLKLSYSRTTLKTVADAITQQVGIVFSYEIALADYPMENLYVTEQGAALDAILKTVFTPRGIDYRVVDKVVVLTRSAHPAQTVRAAPAKAQVTGVVRDAAGNPMIGVTAATPFRRTRMRCCSSRTSATAIRKSRWGSAPRSTSRCRRISW